MYWYCVSRSMAFWTIALSRRKTGPWLGSRNSASSFADALQRRDEVRDVRAVVGVDHADAAVLVDVVAAEEQVAHLEASWPGVWPGVCQTSSFRSPTAIMSPSLSSRSTLHRGIGISMSWALIVA